MAQVCTAKHFRKTGLDMSSTCRLTTSAARAEARGGITQTTRRAVSHSYVFRSNSSGFHSDSGRRLSLSNGVTRLRHKPIGKRTVFSQSSTEQEAILSTETDQSSSQPVAMFTTSSCPYCNRAKELFRTLGVDYKEVDLSTDVNLLQRVKEATGRSTVPQIFIGGTLIGGYDELAASSSQVPDLVEKARDSGADALPSALRDLLAGVEAPPTAPVQAQPTLPLTEGAVAGYSREEFLEAESVALQMLHPTAGLPTRTVFGAARGFFWEKEDKCFSGEEAVTWLCTNVPDKAPTRQQAVALATRLQATWQLDHVASAMEFRDSPAAYFRMARDDPQWPLNMGRVWTAPARPAAAVAEDLRRKIEALYSKYLSAEGRAVDYAGLGASGEFCEFIEATGELQQVNLFELSREESIAFFVNVYNMVIIHATVLRGSPSGTLGRLAFFAQARYCIGGDVYSADDIENGVLRGNRAGAASVWCLAGLAQYARGPFGRGDPRRMHAVHPLDPRIHFALVCGAQSCPPIRVYSAATLDAGLSAAAEAFCEDVEIDEAQRQVTLSQIFKWYSIDFGANSTELLRYVAQYLRPERQKVLTDILDLEGADPVTVVYAPYSWELNGK